jgi:nucleoside phosphorylase
MTMDVLLLEDDPAKKTRLLGYLQSEKGKLFGRIDTALCTNDAVTRLIENQYDLFISDVVVPASLGGEPNEMYAVDLFQQIDEGIGDIRRPRYSLAISAADELSLESKDFFVGRPWGILKYDEASDEFRITIAKICAFINGQNDHEAKARTCDIFIITALLDPEYSAIEAVAGVSWSPFEPLDRSQLIRFGEIKVKGKSIRIATAFAPRMGPVPSAVLTAKVITSLRPKLVLMSGICAGIPAKAEIGDVIAAELSWDWQSGKYLDKNGEEAFEIAPHQVSIDDRLRPLLTHLKRDEQFWKSLAHLSVEAGAPLPKLVVGPMASGSAVLADARVSDRIKTSQHRSVAGLDMEVYGVYASAYACDPEMRFLALKAVCDNGDKQKDDRYQAYAATVSAAATVRFIELYAESDT